jgi:translation initiation factor 4E
MPVSTNDILLFLLSSVLVSSDSRVNEPKKLYRSREEELAELEAAGTVDSEKGQFGIAPAAQTLDSKWTIWYERKSEERRPKCLNKVDYLKELKKGGTFQTIPAFWSTWNEVQQICSVPIEGGVNYHLFKDNIKPVWEDPKNIKGGKWSFVLPSATSHQELMKQWMSLMLTILINELGVDSGINGAVLSVRTWGSMFSVWNRNANDKHVIESVSDKLRELFGVSAVKYQRHQVRVKRNNAERAKMANAKRTYSSDDSFSSSDASSSEGEEKPIRPMRPMRRSEVHEVPRSTSAEEITEEKALPEPIQQTVQSREPEVVPASMEPVQPIKFELQGIELPTRLPLPDVDEKNKRRRKATGTKKELLHENRYVEEKPQQQIVLKKETQSLSPLGVGLILTAAIASCVISWALYL